MKSFATPGCKAIFYAVLIAAGALGRESAEAASSTWSGGANDGTFSDSGNWTAGAPGASTGTTNADTGTFTATNGSGTFTTITLPTYLNLSGIAFSGAAPAYTLSGGALDLTSAGTISNSSTGSVAETINSAITLNGGYVFKTLSSTSTLVFGSSASITEAAAGTLTLTGTTGDAGSIAGVISDGAGAAKTSVAITAGNWTLSGNDSFTGGLSIKGGNLILDGSAGGTSGSLSSSLGLTMDGNGNSFTYKSAAGGSTATIGAFNLTGTADIVSSLVFQDAPSATAGGILNFSGAWNFTTNTAQLLNVTMGPLDAFESTDTLTTTSGGPLNTTINQSNTLPNVILNNTDIAGTTLTGGVVTIGAATYTTPSGGTIANDATKTILLDGTSTTVGLTNSSTGINSLVIKDTSARTLAMNGDTLLFGNSTAKLGTILSATGAGPLTIGSSVNDGKVEVNGSGGTLILVNDSASTDTMNSVISNGTNPLLVFLSGTGTWAFAGTNTYSGLTFLNGGGTLVLNNSSALGTSSSLAIANGSLDSTTGGVSIANNINANASLNFLGSSSLTLGGTITIASSSTFNVGGNTLSLTGNIIGTTSPSFPITGTVTKTGPGTLALSGTASTFTTASSFAVSAGALELAASTTVSSGVVSGPLGGATLKMASGTTLEDNGTAITVANPITVTGAVIFTSTGSGSLILDGTSVTVPSTVTLGANTALTVNNTTTINDSVKGAFTLTQNGTGTLVLNGANAFSGVAVAQGTLIGGSSALPSETGSGTTGNASTTVTINTTGLNLAVGDSITGANIKGGTTIASFTSTSITLSQATNSTTGSTATLTIGQTGSFGDSQLSTTPISVGSSTLTGAATLLAGTSTSGSVEIDRAVSEVASPVNSSLTIGGGNTSGTATYTGAITLTGATSLVAATGGTTDFKTGAWTTNNKAITVGAAGSTGTVEVESTVTTTAGVGVKYGTFNVAGTVNAPVTVSSGATLSGSGTIAPGAASTGVTVQSGANFASGGVQSNAAPYTAAAGTKITNVAGLSSALTVNAGAELTFALGVGSTGTFASPNTNSSYIAFSGPDSANEINFTNTSTGTIAINLIDLTTTAPTLNTTLGLRLQDPYLLMQAGSNSDYDLITSLNGVLSVDGNGYVVGVGTSTTSYNANAFTFTVNALGGVVPINNPGNYGGLQLYLNNGDLEVIPEPGTWALMIGGLGVLILCQKRRQRKY